MCVKANQRSAFRLTNDSLLSRLKLISDRRYYAKIRAPNRLSAISAAIINYSAPKLKRKTAIMVNDSVKPCEESSYVSWLLVKSPRIQAIDSAADMMR